MATIVHSVSVAGVVIMVTKDTGAKLGNLAAVRAGSQVIRAAGWCRGREHGGYLVPERLGVHTSLLTKALIITIENISVRILRIIHWVGVKPIEVYLAGVVARLLCPEVVLDNARSTGWTVVDILGNTVSAAAGETVGALLTLAALGEKLVAWALGQNTGLVTKIRLQVNHVGADTVTSTTEISQETWVVLHAAVSCLIGYNVRSIGEWPSGFGEALIVSTIIIDIPIKAHLLLLAAIILFNKIMAKIRTYQVSNKISKNSGFACASLYPKVNNSFAQFGSLCGMYHDTGPLPNEPKCILRVPWGRS